MRLRLGIKHASVAYAHDVIMAAASFALSLYLRVGDQLPSYSQVLALGTALMAVIALVVFRWLGLYRGIWRYASTNDLIALGRASTIVILIFVPALFVLTRAETLPRSVPIINWVLLLFMIGGPRFVYRVLKDRRNALANMAPDNRAIPVLLVGAGDGAELFIRAATQSNRAQLYRPVGMVAEGAGRVGRNIHGLEVLGTFSEISQIVERLAQSGDRPQRLILTREDLDGATVRRLVETADALGLTVARMPPLVEIRAGSERLEIRPVAIEDLLGRPQTVLDRDSMRGLVVGKRVLVTGAGGTIGGELVRQICRLGPAHVTLLDSGEYNLYQIDLEVSESHPELPRRAVLADIRERARLEQALHEAKPELVFHAAALKHVPMVEANPLEGLRTNVLGTRNVADACRAAGVAVMVQISTDKAVNPTSVMGASKRLAEAYCQALDIADPVRRATRFVTVRFGNVLGSTGSVVPLFQRQLAAGGPLTVTHAEVMRYFMTVREAVELVLQATVLGSAGEASGKIFVLDMGEPVRILDLARQMIRLAGKRPDIDIPIRITGLRPGEKLFEEIFHGAEPLIPTACSGILLAAPRAGDAPSLSAAIDQLGAACERGDFAGANLLLHRLVPEYRGPDGEADNVVVLSARRSS